MDKTKVEQVISTLESMYPSAKCELEYSNNFELLIAVILSAQCTDKRVNVVTKELFKQASTPKDFVEMNISELEGKIYSCGFYKNKAKSIKNASLDIIERFNGEVPSTFEELITLQGVGRKTANVMLSVAFDKEALAVDTHVFRVARRLGWSQGKNPLEVERDVVKLLGESSLSRVHHLLIFHGRYCCKSQNPDCSNCKLRPYCIYNV